MRGWGVVVMAMMATLGATPADAARIPVTPSRAELFFSTSQDADCSMLHKTVDAELPFNVVRLTASPNTSVPADQLTFQWSLPNPAVGMLAADDDIPQDETTHVIRSFCAEIGNQCILTKEQLAVYSKPTILWLAPVCEPVVGNKKKGGSVKFNVKVKQGKKKIGKGSVSVGYGRTSSVTLLLDGKGDTPNGVPTDIRAAFSASIDPAGQTLPKGNRTFDFKSGQASGDTVVTPADSASTVLTYDTPGKVTATVETRFADGSALCDGLLVNVLAAINRVNLEATATPKRSIYNPGDPTRGTVDLRVRVRNTSSREDGSAVLFIGAGVLTCETTVRVGAAVLTNSTQIDFQHCSVTTGQACESDTDCGGQNCPSCDPGEMCVTYSHCPNLATDTGDPLGCTSDADCRGGPCIKVLPLASLVLDIGDAADLVTATIPLANTLPSTAQVTETWTVNPKNAGPDSTTLRYRIQSNPNVKP